MRVSEAEYKRLAVERREEKLELHRGVVQSKPPMTWAHNLTARGLYRILIAQLDRREFDVIVDQARVRRSASRYYIPDLFVVPMDLVRRGVAEHRHELEAYREPLPLVVEVWSPSTGAYDVETKLPQYQQRGDLEIWHIHPYEKTVTVWRRQPDGSYKQRVFTEDVIVPVALPGVTIDVASLFDWE